LSKRNASHHNLQVSENNQQHLQKRSLDETCPKRANISTPRSLNLPNKISGFQSYKHALEGTPMSQNAKILIKINGCFCNQSGNENKNKII
jgi:hypothetical protein